MKKLLTILVLGISLTVYGQSKQIVDTFRIAILPYESNWLHFGEQTPAELTNNEAELVESILKKCISEYNSQQENIFKKQRILYPNKKLNKQRYIINLKRYKRQYIVVKNSKGEKEVLINCFCGDGGENWKKEFMMALDGGNCYFKLKINLTTGKYYDFEVNGLA